MNQEIINLIQKKASELNISPKDVEFRYSREKKWQVIFNSENKKIEFLKDYIKNL